MVPITASASEINIDEINKNFCKKNNIDNNEVLLKFLDLKGLSFEDHKRNLENYEKIKCIASKEFSKSADIVK